MRKMAFWMAYFIINIIYFEILYFNMIEFVFLHLVSPDLKSEGGSVFSRGFANFF